jgi:DNA-directed RNA polymerase specialized sigma24 family protein
MEIQPTLPNPTSALSRRLSVVAAREHGVGPEQLPLIGIDADIFDVFYREHIGGVEGFVARRIGDRERAADLTAEIFLAAIDSAHRYRPALGTPRAWLLGIARILVAGDHRRQDRRRTGEAPPL